MKISDYKFTENNETTIDRVPFHLRSISSKKITFVFSTKKNNSRVRGGRCEKTVSMTLANRFLGCSKMSPYVKRAENQHETGLLHSNISALAL